MTIQGNSEEWKKLLTLFLKKKKAKVHNIDQKCFQVPDRSKWLKYYIFCDSSGFTSKILRDLMRQSYNILVKAAAGFLLLPTITNTTFK